MTMPMLYPRPDVAEGLKAAMRHVASSVTVITAGRGAARRGLTPTAYT